MRFYRFAFILLVLEGWTLLSIYWPISIFNWGWITALALITMLWRHRLSNTSRALIILSNIPIYIYNYINDLSVLIPAMFTVLTTLCSIDLFNRPVSQSQKNNSTPRFHKSPHNTQAHLSLATKSPVLNLRGDHFRPQNMLQASNFSNSFAQPIHTNAPYSRPLTARSLVLPLILFVLGVSAGLFFFPRDKSSLSYLSDQKHPSYLHSIPIPVVDDKTNNDPDATPAKPDPESTDSTLLELKHLATPQDFLPSLPQEEKSLSGSSQILVDFWQWLQQSAQTD